MERAMPYIKEKRRSEILIMGNIDISKIENSGELNFSFYKIINEYFNKEGKGNYQAINDIMGALEGAKLEFLRRVVAPYEEIKIKENGDV